MDETQTFLAALGAYLSDIAGRTVAIEAAKPLAGGASRDTWAFDARQGDYVERLVLRRDLPTQMFDEALSREQEFHLMDAARRAGVRVARVRYLCTDERVLGSPFFIMDYVPGISIGPKVIHAPEMAAARTLMPQQMAEELAAIHRIDLSDPRLSFLAGPPDGLTPTQHVIAQTYAILDKLDIANPTWEWALRWAENHAPAAATLRFVHGDFRIGNLLVDAESGLSAVIDWEFGHIGDPDEELGYVCMRDWRFGQGTQRFAGLADREPFLQAYEAASGRQVSREAVDWWEIMGNIRWGVICMSQANRHLSGEEPSVELASLGRRSAEMQLETLRLIAEQGF